MKNKEELLKQLKLLEWKVTDLIDYFGLDWSINKKNLANRYITPEEELKIIKECQEYIKKN